LKIRLLIEINHFKFKSSVHLKMTLELSSRQIVRHQIDVLLDPVFVQYCADGLIPVLIRDIAVVLVAQIEVHRVREALAVVLGTKLEHSTS
jgi:hypothetical protein